MSNKVLEKDLNGNNIRVPHIIDMHLNAAFVEKVDKMVVSVELMRCQLRDVQLVSRGSVTDLPDFERSLLFAQLAELRKETTSILNGINDLSQKTHAWATKRCVQISTPAKPIVEQFK